MAAEAGRDAADRPAIVAAGRLHANQSRRQFCMLSAAMPPRVLYPDMPDNYRARIDLQWPIYTGGRVDALERAAGAEREAAAFDVAAARADLRLEIDPRVLGARDRTASRGSRRPCIEAIEAHVRELRSRYDQGLIPPNERADGGGAALAPAPACRSRRPTCGESPKPTCGASSGADGSCVRTGDRRSNHRQCDVVALGEALDAKRKPSGRSGVRSPAGPAPHASASSGQCRRVRRRSRSARGLRLRAAESPHLSACRRVARFLGRVGQRQLVAVGWRPAPRRGGRSTAATRALDARASRIRSSTCVRGRAAAARARVQRTPPSAPPRTAFAPRSRRDGSSGSGSPPALRRTPTCSTRRPRCSRRSSIARARIANARLARGAPRTGHSAD